MLLYPVSCGFNKGSYITRSWWHMSADSHMECSLCQYDLVSCKGSCTPSML
jgi:hypothetical protein